MYVKERKCHRGGFLLQGEMLMSFKIIYFHENSTTNNNNEYK